MRISRPKTTKWQHAGGDLEMRRYGRYIDFRAKGQKKLAVFMTREVLEDALALVKEG